MAKKVKMAIYGEPGTGKSYFAVHSWKPFFITTDGNYEWLIDFGAKEEDHIEVSSWAEAKKAFKMDFSNYETIVIDLTEDLFKWCEYEYCSRNKLEHIGDLGYGKGYDITRNEFFIEMCKLISLDKHIIFIMHGETQIVKDRRGVEHTKYIPSSKIPAKVVDSLEGRLRYFLRCYCKAETSPNGKVVKKRYLSLIPKENEFGIHRGVDENDVPQDIELDFDLFAECIGLTPPSKEEKEPLKQNVSQEKVEEAPKQKRTYHKKQQEVESVPTLEQEDKPEIQDEPDVKQLFLYGEISKPEEVKKEPAKVIEEPIEQPKEAQPERQLTQAEKIAAIKAKLAAKNK